MDTSQVLDQNNVTNNHFLEEQVDNLADDLGADEGEQNLSQCNLS